MANKPFAIQGADLTLGGVNLQAGSTGVVIPGVTQAVNFQAEEVDDTGDQTRTFNSPPIVIDRVTYNDYVNSGTSSNRAEYEVEELDDDDYIDGIDIVTNGSYTSGESSTNQSNDMKAYIGSAQDPFASFNSSDWASIPFRPKMRADEVESIGGGGNSDRLVNDDKELILNSDGSLTFPGTLDYKIGESFGGGSLSITSEGAVVIFTNSVESFKSWTFNTNGNLDLPEGGEIRFSYGYIDQDENVNGNALRISGGAGVVIKADEDGKTWEFSSNGALRLPSGGDIVNSSGQSVLGGGATSYTPEDTDHWNAPTVNTIAAALDELAARMAAFENFEIDGGNANTPAAGELTIDGNGA